MLMERNQVIIGVAFSVLLIIGTVVGIAFDRSWVTGGYNVTAYFTDAAGLQAGDSVLIAGVRSGAVESVTLTGDEDKGYVQAVMRVEEPMPSDSSAAVILQNFLGKRAVMLRAGNDWDDELRDGDEIPVDRTNTPVDFAELNQESVELLRGSDVDALRELVTSVADVTEGQRDEVERLLDGLQRITQVIADRRDDLQTVIDKSEDVFGTLADKDQQLLTIIDRFGSTLEMLAERRQDIERLLVETARSSHLAADLVADQREQLDRVLDELHRDLEIIDAHQVDISHIFAYGGASFEGYANIARQGGLGPQGMDNPYWTNIFAQSQGDVGTDALVGCGGTIDEFLDQVFGEDPRTCEEQDAEGGGSRSQQESNSFRSLFSRSLEVGR